MTSIFSWGVDVVYELIFVPYWGDGKFLNPHAFWGMAANFDSITGV